MLKISFSIFTIFLFSILSVHGDPKLMKGCGKPGMRRWGRDQAQRRRHCDVTQDDIVVGRAVVKRCTGKTQRYAFKV